MAAVTHEDWSNLRAYVQRIGPAAHARVLDDFDLLLDVGLPLPLTVSAGSIPSELRIQSGILELVVEGTVYRAPTYRHTDSSGRRSQTRSVYLDDETWEALCALGDPNDVMREALRSYVRARPAGRGRGPGKR